MRLIFLGKNTQGNGSPTLFLTDRDTYVVQGWKTNHGDASVEIPGGLLLHLLPGTELDTPLIPTGRDSYVLTGAPMTDPDALTQMDIPSHETCIEVGKAEEGRGNGAAEG